MKKHAFAIAAGFSFAITLFLSAGTCFAQFKIEKLLGEQEDIARPAPETFAYDTETEGTIKRSQETIAYTSQNLRDPFALTIPQELMTATIPAEAPPLPALKVEGFVWGSNLPQAIIGGKVYGIGDTVQGAKITGIDKNGITLLYNGYTYTVR